jgi:hypothetical protein
MRHSKQNSCEHVGITARSAMACKQMVQWSSSTSGSGSSTRAGSSSSVFGDTGSSLARFGGGVADGAGPAMAESESGYYVTASLGSRFSVRPPALRPTTTTIIRCPMFDAQFFSDARRLFVLIYFVCSRKISLAPCGGSPLNRD